MQIQTLASSSHVEEDYERQHRIESSFVSVSVLLSLLLCLFREYLIKVCRSFPTGLGDILFIVGFRASSSIGTSISQITLGDGRGV